MDFNNNYYVSSFFWSTFSKILTAVVGFISVPLLLGYYGKAEYGILSLATACNSYMHLLDLGMNVGAVKFFSQWKAEGNNPKIYRVARTNITFYGIIAIVNMLGLFALAFWGEPLFAISHNQFLQLQTCLIIIAVFCIISWGATTFNQLLIADKHMAFTMQMQCVIAILKGLLIVAVFIFDLSLSSYFFFLTSALSLLVIPYIIKCKQLHLIDKIMPAYYWNEFKIVMTFSLSIFALSLFQMTATQSRPIVLGIFANNGADVVADFRILEVIPQFIIMICGSLSGIFLPKTSEIYTRENKSEIEHFAYRGTVLTSILACSLCVPFMLCSKEILTAYVGAEHSTLAPWLSLWLVLVLCQVHSTPTNALILAKGKTKPLVVVSCLACIISIIVNAILAPYYNVGSAVIGYTIYIFINLFCNYMFFYKKLLEIRKIKVFLSFIIPCLFAILSMSIVDILLHDYNISIGAERLNMLLGFSIKTLVWIILFSISLLLFKVVRIKNQILTFWD